METFLGIDYPTWWFIVLVALFSGYAILEGFDYGVGAWHLFLGSENSRQLAFAAIGPVWSGNEVWLVIGAGALFAGFPVIYATLFSAMYTPLMLFLAFIIFRAVSIEFRNKEKMRWWRRSWDVLYCISSIMLAFLIGVIFGNVLGGFKIGDTGDYVGSKFFAFLHPFTILTGFMVLFLFMSHGAIFLLLKTENALYARVKILQKISIIIFICLLILVSVYAAISFEHLGLHFQMYPVLYVLPVMVIGSIAGVNYMLKRGRCHRAFIFSCLTIVLLLLIAATGIYPNILISTVNPDYSLNVFNSSSSINSLKNMMIIAGIGMPFVLGYTFFAYKTFRGKVKIEDIEH